MSKIIQMQKPKQYHVYVSGRRGYLHATTNCHVHAERLARRLAKARLDSNAVLKREYVGKVIRYCAIGNGSAVPLPLATIKPVGNQ